MSARHTLSVIIIAMNEADRIRPCLESVAGLADEIIVLDSGSSDDTVAICREFTDQVFVTDWPGDGIQKQRALDKACMEWVLRIDADERVSPKLGDEIRTILAQQTIAETAFRIPWATYVFGRYLTNGQNGAFHTNLFRREGAHYGDNFVHGGVHPAPGPRRKLRGVLYHDAWRGYRHVLQKFSDYACHAANRKYDLGETSGLGKAVAHAAWRFFSIYVLKGGFKDGSRGLLMAIVYSQYVFNKYAALWAQHQPGLPSPDNWKPPAE